MKKSTTVKAVLNSNLFVVITLTKARDIFYLKEDMTCESIDLVYVVIFATCNKEHSGKTAKSINSNMNN